MIGCLAIRLNNQSDAVSNKAAGVLNTVTCIVTAPKNPPKKTRPEVKMAMTNSDASFCRLRAADDLTSGAPVHLFTHHVLLFPEEVSYF